jgi:hypothetical protein
MQVTTFPPAVLAAVLGACESEPVLLNSERIEQRFGSYGIKALTSEPGLRRSSLYSTHGDREVCRTYALVRFADQLDDRYCEEHAKVLAGHSIGAIFRSHGWDLHKQTMHIGRVALPTRASSIGELMQVDEPQGLALHVYQLLLVRNEQVFEYATIAETHHPEYLSERDLAELYTYDKTMGFAPQAVTDLTQLLFSATK